MNNDLIAKYSKTLLESIPVVKGMNLEISSIEENGIILSAPLNTHINYEGTAFGGSLNTVCILSCYLSIHHILNRSNAEFSSLVIQRSHIEYKSPVTANFKAISIFPKESLIERFLKSLEQRGVARISIDSYVLSGDSKDKRVLFSGQFVASR